MLNPMMVDYFVGLKFKYEVENCLLGFESPLIHHNN